MQIDWVTVAAQVVNFLVLVWLLQRFLYKPITGAMKERERKIRERLEDAERARAAAEDERSRLEQERASLEHTSEDVLRAARERAESLRRALEREARTELDDLRDAGRAQIARETDEFLDTLRREAAEQFETLARAALADLADAELEARVAAAFVAQLEALSDAERRELADAAADAERVTVESAFELGADARGRVSRAVHAALAPDVDVAFARSDRLICGVRLRAGGRVAQWTLDSYLDRFRQELADVLAQAAPAAREKAAE